MATSRTRWLLSILLVNLSNCFTLAGPPAPPSLPECYIPCVEENCTVDIHCTWDPKQDPQIPTNYSLHWEAANTEEGHVINGTSSNEIISREHFSNGELRVWVQAKNQHGSAKSQEAVFNTAEIIKPPPPNVNSSHQEPSVIEWISTCEKLQLSLGPCDVRHRTEADQVWLKEEDGFHSSYIFDSPQPCTVYEFQVRCVCATGLMSDWSAIHKMQNKEIAPVGELDVWRDCGISTASFDCVLTWKLSVSQTCLILGYDVRLVYNNGTAVSSNVSAAEPRGQLVCNEMQCHFNSSLKDVSSVSVSAYNADGSTVPSHLAMPISGKEKNEQAILVKMNEENLTVFWDLPSQLTDNLKKYVVQYKQAGCPPGQGFDWIKVEKKHTTGFFKGQFKKYTPYQVSLFTVSNSSKIHHLSSVIGYSFQGPPSRVSSFKVFSIAATRVTLLWEPVPLSKQNGVILYYQIGVDRQNVYNVSASPQHENKTFELLHLSPGQEYEVWIRAVTVAGPGENTTTRFKTKHHEDFALLIPVLLGLIILGVICLSFVLLSACRGESKACPLLPLCFYEKVPDPRNSHIFRQMKHQINDPFAWICIPVSEPHPKISLLEVVEIQPRAFKSSLEKTSDPDGLTRLVVGDGCSELECQDDQREDAVTEDCHRTDHRHGREEYSKMVDSDDERDKEEEEEEEEDRGDCWSSSEKEQLTSGYEKHFMPTALEVLEI